MGLETGVRRCLDNANPLSPTSQEFPKSPFSNLSFSAQLDHINASFDPPGYLETTYVKTKSALQMARTLMLWNPFLLM